MERIEVLYELTAKVPLETVADKTEAAFLERYKSPLEIIAVCQRLARNKRYTVESDRERFALDLLIKACDIWIDQNFKYYGRITK